MWRALAPYLTVALLIAGLVGVGYGLGGPVWLVYAGIIIAVLVVLPGYERWDRHHHPG